MELAKNNFGNIVTHKRLLIQCAQQQNNRDKDGSGRNVPSSNSSSSRSSLFVNLLNFAFATAAFIGLMQKEGRQIKGGTQIHRYDIVIKAKGVQG